MRIRRFVGFGLAWVLLLGACDGGGGGTSTSDGAVDAGVSDAAPDVTDPTDKTDDPHAGSDASDATEAGDTGTTDSTGSDGSDRDAGDGSNDGSELADGAGDADDGETSAAAGFGAISGMCGVLDDELTSPQAHLVSNHIDFGMDPYDMSDRDRLTMGGREVLDDGNAGGSSVLSEVFAYEVLHRCEMAGLQKTETEIVYEDPMGKKTDLLVAIDGSTIGVSVTRAVAWPHDEPYPTSEAKSLLEDKLTDIDASTANVAAEDAWQKQILHIIAYGDRHAESVREAWGQIDASTKGDTIGVVTVSDGMDGFLY